MILVVTGVSGCGKSTIGQLLADELKWSFYEGDDFHPPENVEKMRQNTPLNDADRLPWLMSLKKLIADVKSRDESAVLTCSALRKTYRDLLREADDALVFVYLKGEFDLIQERLLQRSSHYMPADLLSSQFEILEEPKNALIVEITQRPDEIVRHILESFANHPVTCPPSEI